MKHLILLFAAFFTFNLGYSQIYVGPRFGVHTPSSTLKDATRPQELANLSLENSLGFRAGIFARILLGSLYIQPELLVTTHQSKYSFEDLTNPSGIQFRSENGLNLDIPAVVGIKFDAFRIQAGPVASFNLSQNSDFIDKDTWTRSFNNADWGIQMGAGIDLWKLILDVNYQLPLNQSSEGISIGGQSYEINSSKGQVIVSVGLNLK